MKDMNRILCICLDCMSLSGETADNVSRWFKNSKNALENVVFMPARDCERCKGETVPRYDHDRLKNELQASKNHEDFFSKRLQEVYDLVKGIF